jgi:cobalt-zinc-cadmium efflux system outer membrane protein
MKSCRFINWIVWIVLLPLSIFAQSPDKTALLSDLIQEGLTNNPAVNSEYNSWQESLTRIPQAGALPDPQLSLNLLNMPVNTFKFDQEPMTGKQIALMQMFPFPGKLGKKEDIAESGAEISQARFEEQKNQLKKDITLTYFDIFFVDKSMKTVEKNKALLEDFTQIAQTRYTVGKGIQQDVLKAQVELSKMEEHLITLEQKRVALVAHLNSLLNRPAGTPFGKTVEPVIDTLNYDLDQLRTLSEEYRPLLKAWKSMIRQSEAKTGLAKKEYLPDFKLGIAYTQREELRNGSPGVDFLSGLMTLDIPLYFWRKQNKKVEESRYSEQMVRERYQDIRNGIFAELDRFTSDLDRNFRLVELYKNGIIPQATQSLNSAIAGYQTDKVDFLTLLNNEMSLFNFELDYYRYLTDYRKTKAELEATIGIDHNERE